METKIFIGFEYIDSKTPQLPEAKCGDFSKTVVRETKEQLDNGLLWWKCIFCGGYVLIDTKRHTRERCQCGARRVNHYNNAGWKLNDEVGWYI